MAAASTNTVDFLPDRVIKHYGPKRPFVKFWLRQCLDGMGWRQPVEYRSAARRLAFEAATLATWRRYGFLAPAVLRQGMDTLEMARLDATPLDEILASPAADAGLIVAVEEMARRHAVALTCGEKVLCHVDANPRNILIAGEAVWHVDFEMGREGEPVGKWQTRELAKFLVGVVSRLPAARASAFLEMFLRRYPDHEALARLVGEKLGRRRVDRQKALPGSLRAVCLALDLALLVEKGQWRG